MKKYLYKFKNRSGLQVKGIFIKPDKGVPVKRYGIVYLAGSVLGCVAVHRLGLDMAEMLALKGYISYLFDHSRIGESEGVLPSDTSQNLNRHVISGEMVGDTLEAIEHFKKECGVDDIILIGHCGGGLTALYTASVAKAVKGALLISTPVLKEGESDLSRLAGATKEYQMLYTRKASSIGAWKRLFTGKTDYAQLGKFIKNRILQMFPHKRSSPAINNKFLAALENSKKGKKIRMLMGDRDPGIEEYKIFADRYLDRVNESRVLKEASHGFVTGESIRLLFGEVNDFVKTFN